MKTVEFSSQVAAAAGDGGKSSSAGAFFFYLMLIISGADCKMQSAAHLLASICPSVLPPLPRGEVGQK